MELYLLKSTICLAIFYCVYKLLLEKENMHYFKRFYLIGILLASFSIPLITFSTYIEPVVVNVTSSQTEQQFIPTSKAIFAEAQTNYFPYILFGLYGLGVLIFSIKFIKNLRHIILKINRNPKQKAEKTVNVLLKENIVPHTFLSFIFLNKQKFETHQIPKEVLLHEETHARQKHSLDVLFIELLQTFFWFNPLIYLIKRSIKLNHEFLADQAVLNYGIAPSVYQKILLTFSSKTQNNQLVSAINYSLIKKRFTVMKTKTSKRNFWFRSLIILPLLAILIYSFSSREIIEKEVAAVEPIAIQQTQGKTKKTETSKENIKDQSTSKQSIKSKKVTPESYFSGVRFISYKKGIQYNDTIIGVKEDIIFDKKYTDFTEIEKKKNPTIRIMTFIRKPKRKKSPTQEEIEEYKKSKTYAIWIDGESVPNSELDSYKPEEIAYLSGKMFITKKGRKGKYPQPFWCMFYTHEYFDNHKMGEQKRKYHGSVKTTFKSVEKINKNYNE